MVPVLTLRARATVVATLLCAVVLVSGAVLLVRTVDAQLTSSRDDLARSRVHDLMDQAAAGELTPVLRNVTDDSVAQVFTRDGRVLAASDNIQGRQPIVAAGAQPGGAAQTIRGPDDREEETYRVWVQSGRGPDGPVTVVEGSSLESVREATATLRRTLLVGVPLALAVLVLGMWWVLGRALARLDRIRAEVDGLAHDQMDTRIADGGRHDEVGRLAATMNRMLARVEGAVQRQRRLVADVSHDLRGPLATQRLSLELALASPEAVDTDVLRADVLGATGEMERLVDDLLVLAAADEGAGTTAEAVDLDQIVLEEAIRARSGADVVIDTSQVSAGPVAADPSELRRIVRNLVDNAVGHARARVALSVGVVAPDVWLDVVDDGPGVAPQDRERVFERFHRGDAARTRGGTGLGLAIARELAVRAGGSLTVAGVDEGSGSDPGGAVFRLVLPALDGSTSRE